MSFTRSILVTFASKAPGPVTTKLTLVFGHGARTSSGSVKQNVALAGIHDPIGRGASNPTNARPAPPEPSEKASGGLAMRTWQTGPGSKNPTLREPSSALAEAWLRETPQIASDMRRRSGPAPKS